MWRVCVHQGVGGLPSLEDVYSTLCRLFVPPVHTSRTSSSPFAALGDSLQWHICGEMHLLVSSLLKHSLPGGSGTTDRSLGRALLLPGTAAAVAREALTQWLRPEAEGGKGGEGSGGGRGVREAAEALAVRPEAGGAWQGGGSDT